MYYRLFLIPFILFASAAQAGDEAIRAPTAVVADLHSALVRVDAASADQGDQSNSFNARLTALSPILARAHDFPYMARLTVSNHWKSLTTDQRDAFVAAFTELSIATYAARFIELSDVRFRLIGDRPMPRGRVEVQTGLVGSGTASVALNYLLHETTDGWRIINVLADGVSDLALKRSEYQDVLSSGQFEALLAHIRHQTEIIVRDSTGTEG